MKRISVLFAMLFSVMMAYSQEKTENKKPDEQTIVNKEYDEDGNLISFDSTYIHKWSSDTTLNFNFPEDEFFAGGNFPDIERLLDGILGDSAFQHFNSPDPSFFPPFDGEEFMRQFEHSFPDSAFFKNFEFRTDSMDLHHKYILPDMKEFQKQMEEQFKHYDFPEPYIDRDLTDQQKKELEELVKKHRKEMEELRKKWGENK